MTLADSIHNLSPIIIRFSDDPDIALRWYGLSYVLAFVAGYYLLRFLVRRGYSEMPEEKLTDFITFAAIFGVTIGGRLGYMLLYSPKEFFSDPLLFFRFLDGGMASHGGIAGLALFTLYFAKRHGYHWRHIGDNLCVVAPTGIAIVRCANFINGELWGNITTKEATPWAMKFPTELKEMELDAGQIENLLPAEEIEQLIAYASDVQPGITSLEQVVEISRQALPVTDPNQPLDQAQRVHDLLDQSLRDDLLLATTEIDPAANTVSKVIELGRDNESIREVAAQYINYRHPSQIYQALLEGLALFLILFAVRLRWRNLPYGILTALFFIGYASFRILGELFRHPDAGTFPGTSLSKGQFYSLFMYAVGAAFIAYAIYERKYKAPLDPGRLDAPPPAAGD